MRADFYAVFDSRQRATVAIEMLADGTSVYVASWSRTTSFGWPD